jgi:hypothetical protein
LFEKIDKFETLPGGIVPYYKDNWRDFVALRSLYKDDEKSLEEAKNYINEHDEIVQEIVYLSKSSRLTTKNYLDYRLRDKLKNLTTKQKEKKNERILQEFVRMVDRINTYISDAYYNKKLFNKRHGYGLAIARI